ncbi:hypothetical protein P4S64_20840 [Vibrio sp. M60_M31a]
MKKNQPITAESSFVSVSSPSSLFANIYWLQPLLPVLQKEFQVSSLAANLAMSAPLFGMGLGLLIFRQFV